MTGSSFSSCGSTRRTWTPSRGTYTEEDWQSAIEQHPFVAERNLPVVIAFEDEDGDPRLYGPTEYVDKISEGFDWDGIQWGHSLTLSWETED